MAGFLKKLFSGGQDSSPTQEAEPYEGCMIAPAPENAGGTWRVAGTITKEIDGEIYERTFVRADTFTGQDEAVKFTLLKGRQIIDQNGKGLFSDGAKSRPA